MGLTLRRAGEARALLLAAGVASLAAITVVTGLVSLRARALEVGRQAVVDGAPAAERSLLITGPLDADGHRAALDAAVRAAVAGGLRDVPVTVTAARYGTGRQLTGDLGQFRRPGGGLVFAAMATLDGLAAHVELTGGGWPRPDGGDYQVTLPEAVAGRLGVHVGDKVPVTDRATDRRGELTVAGLWRPLDAGDPYWRLAPQVDAGTDASTIGPFVLDPAAFSRVFPHGTSAAWVVAPDLRTASGRRIVELGRAADRLAEDLSHRLGPGASARVDTRLAQLGDRLARADVVGRSGLYTPVLLIVLLGAYALVLVAALLGEDRRGHTALLRARGAVRWQLAALATREAALVVLPLAVFAPPLATRLLAYVDRFGVPGGVRYAEPEPTASAWVLAAAVAVGCVLALLGPALRNGGSYVAELAARSRPGRWAPAQRAGVDLALLGLAVLAWTQLRLYSSRSGPALSGVDPLLAAAPTLGLLAGTVLALRLVPLGTRLAERLVDRRSWNAAVLGVWQAGRRPRTGTLLLLSLAVGASTLSLSMAATWQRSLSRQADHRVGADLRITERGANVPDGRAAQLAALPGVRVALPAWRDEIAIGEKNLPATVVAIDAAAAPGVARLDGSLVGGRPGTLFGRLAAARSPLPDPPLPAGALRLTGTVRTWSGGRGTGRVASTELLLTTGDGQSFAVPAATSPGDGSATPFSAALPDTAGRPVRLAGFRVTARGPAGSYRFEAGGLRVVGRDGAGAPADLGDAGWVVVGGGKATPAVRSSRSGVSAGYALPAGFATAAPTAVTTFAVVRRHPNAPVPAAVTPQVLGELSVRVGDTVPVPLPGGTVTVKVVGVLDTVPTTAGGAGLLLDLPSAVDGLLHGDGLIRPVAQWWIACDPARHAAAARAAAELPEVAVLDRTAEAAASDRDPYWVAARIALLATVFGVVLLAVVGLGVDMWATARRRLPEWAVLRALGGAPRLLAAALLVEQALLAGVGVAVGVAVGGGIGAVTAPLVILTPSADRPVPAPVFEMAWVPVTATAAGLAGVALLLGGLVTLLAGKRVTDAQLRIGADR